MSEQPEWMNDPAVQKIPTAKLQFLEEIINLGKGKNQKELMKLYLPILKKAKQNNLTFTPEEVNVAISAIRSRSSAEEQEKIDQMINKITQTK